MKLVQIETYISLYHSCHFTCVFSTVAPTGDHVISLVDEISFTFPPAPPLSQIDDIPPEQFCNGDNRPADCGANCMCTHQVDIPHNAVVEVVLVDEGNLKNDSVRKRKKINSLLYFHSLTRFFEFDFQQSNSRICLIHSIYTDTLST